MPTLIVLLIGLLLPWPGAAADWQTLQPGVQLLRGRFVAGQQPDGNSVLLRNGAAALLFDAGRHPAHSQALLDVLLAQPPAELALVNSHWHLDHSGGLALLRQHFPNAELHASRAIEHARHGFLASYRQQLEQRLATLPADSPERAGLVAERQRIDGAAAMLPSDPVESSGSRVLAGQAIELGLAGGVSGGDVWLYDRDRRLLLAGDLVTLPAPLFDTACPQRWQAELAQLGQRDFATLVPGHGRPLSRPEFDRWRQGFDALLDCAAGTESAATCRERWLQAVADLIEPDQVALAGALLDYYLPSRLRNHQALSADCAERAQ